MSSAITENGRLVHHVVRAAVLAVTALLVGFIIVFNFTDFF